MFSITLMWKKCILQISQSCGVGGVTFALMTECVTAVIKIHKLHLFLAT